jgi:hypothetical protein
MKHRIVGLFALAALGIAATAAICGNDEPQNRQRTIDVDALTFEDLQQRALAAVRQPGDVYHLVATTKAPPGDYVQDIWLDVDNALARRQNREGESIDLQYGDRRASLFDERLYDGPCDPCPANAAAMFVPHLDWIFSDNFKDRSLDEATVGGEPAIEVRVTREYGGDYTGDATATIRLDESFRPLDMRVDPPGPLPDRETTFTDEFVARETLDAGFFSVDALRALAGGPLSDLDAALAAGLDVYWLGEAFESMILRDESRFYARGSSGDGAPAMIESYGPPDFAQPAPCAQVRVQQLGARAPISVPDGTPPFDTVEISGATAILYRSPRVALPVPPPHPSDPGEGADATIDPSAVPVGTAPELTPVPDDVGEFYAAVITTADTVIEVATNCGPIGSNPYRTEAAFRRLIESLRPYAPAG